MKQEIKKVTWDNVRERVYTVNKEFAQLIDSMSPGEELYLYVANYKYGTILDDGKSFYYPTKKNGVENLNSTSDKQLIKDFSYTNLTTPAGMVLHNSLEVFFNVDDHTIPCRIFKPGEIFALWAHLEITTNSHPTPIIQLSAGARTIFMLPNISDKYQFDQLKRKSNLRIDMPEQLQDQWKLFNKLLINSDDDWNAEVLLFPKKWLELIKEDNSWKDVYLYMLKIAWLKSAFQRNQIFYSHAFWRIVSNCNIKPSPYLSDTFQHILSIALGAFPGFKPATDETMAPIKVIQKIFVNNYNLKRYHPTIIHPANFDYTLPNDSIYYSLQYPTTFINSFRSRKAATTLYDLRELKYLFERYQYEVLINDKLSLSQTNIAAVLRSVKFGFYHSQMDPQGEILSTSNLENEDDNLKILLYKSIDKKKFSGSGTFFRGCIYLQSNFSRVIL